MAAPAMRQEGAHALTNEGPLLVIAREMRWYFSAHG